MEILAALYILLFAWYAATRRFEGAPVYRTAAAVLVLGYAAIIWFRIERWDAWAAKLAVAAVGILLAAISAARKEPPWWPVLRRLNIPIEDRR